MKRFAEKVVLVTGASSGLGEAAALLFAAEGAKVVVAARRQDRGEAVVRRVKATGADGLFIKVDVTRRDQVEAMVASIIDRFGKLDCAVNNAGISPNPFTPVADISEEDWDATIATNLKGVWLCMKYEIPAMLAHGRGSIVNVSSIYGYKGSDLGHAHYSASKHAVIGLTKTAAIDYGDKGIRLNAVCPGFSHSEMVDPHFEAAPVLASAILNRHSGMNRLGQAVETAEAIAFLCSDGASFMNGAVLAVDGGDTTRLY